MERQARAAALRRRRLESRRLGERRQRRQPHGRLYAVRVRHHVGPEKGCQRHPGSRMGSDRRRLPAARQAGEPPRGHLVHPRERHLADGMARSSAPAIYQAGEDNARPRPQVVPHRGSCLRRTARRPHRSGAFRRRHAGRQGQLAQRRRRGTVRRRAQHLAPRVTGPLRHEGKPGTQRQENRRSGKLHGHA